MSDELTPRERTMLALRYGPDGVAKMTLQKVGVAMGIPRDRARDRARIIEERAFAKLGIDSSPASVARVAHLFATDAAPPLLDSK